MPKGRSRSRGAPRDYDPNERRRERLDARRAAKAAALAAQRKKERRDTLLRRLGMLVFAAAAIWFLFLRNVTPGEFNGHPVTEFSKAGLGDHLPANTPPGTVNYESTPPVSGQHFADNPVCGTFASVIEGERQVHALEHGAVGIQFQPEEVAPEDIPIIEAIVEDYGDRTFSAPYPPAPSPIVVTSWGRMMELDSLDETAIRQYIDEFRNKGPEDEPCLATSKARYDPAPAITPNLSPSPGPASPSPDDGNGKGGDGKGGKKGG
ncbi:MAG: DUF3105 domain-containing protein [Actinomycetota bacterium]